MKSTRGRASGTPARLLFASLLSACALFGCALFDAENGPDSPAGRVGSPEAEASSAELEVREQRIARLEEDVVRLRADLRHAEDALVSLGSSSGGQRGRADAVSSVAQARGRIDLAAQVGGDSAQILPAARRTLQEAERQLRDGRHETAAYFAARSRRMAEAVLRQAALTRVPAPLRVSSDEVRLRKGPSADYAVIETLARRDRVLAEAEAGDWVRVRAPSGKTGWVHGSLLEGR